MNNNYISHSNLPSLSQLLDERFKEAHTLVNSLKFKDVEDDITFETTKEKIKTKILFEPVLIGEAGFVDFEYTLQSVSTENQSYGNTHKDVYTHEISFPYEGNKELFYHSPNNFSNLNSNHGIIEPSNNTFTVYVDLSELNPNKAKTEAKSLLRLTKDIGEKNNETVQNWNYLIEDKIDEDLDAKRSELFRIFGND